MISGSAICRLRWMDSTSASVPRLVFESVFHLSIRNLARSSCVACATCSNCDSSRFNWLTEAYGTGGALADGAGEDATWATAAVIRKGRIQYRQTQAGKSFMNGCSTSISIFVVFVKLARRAAKTIRVPRKHTVFD